MGNIFRKRGHSVVSYEFCLATGFNSRGCRWSRFSELFFWNQQNYYIGGLDPIFQYSYNPSLYWKYHYLAAGLLTDKTCGADACTEEMLEDTYEVLRRDFDAKYVFLSKELNPEFNQYLEGDSRFKKTFDNGSEAIFSF